MSARIFAALLIATLATTVHATDIDWPQEVEAESGAVIVVYQPQVEKFSGNDLEGRAAVSATSDATGGAPIFGAIWFTAKLDTNLDTRMAEIRDFDVLDVRMEDATDEQKDKVAALIENQIEQSQFSISVDQLVADLDTQSTSVTERELMHEPPKIILSTVPAMLVSIDGDPVLEEIEDTNLERVINSPFLIVKNFAQYYLYVGSDAWFKAGAVAGPWSRANSVPSEVTQLVEPADDPDEVGAMKIIIATEPTELIVSDGNPTWAPVEGMNLLYVDNTDSNAFLDLTTQKYYLLLSGRWYSAEGMLGQLEWTHVPNDELPAAFGDIPEDSVNGAVLSQVAGTEQARDAMLENAIPQTAAIKRDDNSLEVEYDGDPDFAPIEDINVEYALNTSSAVFRYGNLYYVCDEGVWYVGNTATGPWTVATEVPSAIYLIPASNPYHYVTYVKVYDVTPTVVYVGYTPGYYGSYYYRGSVIYGTGWYYRPWYGPFFYPRYPTWGFHVYYSPWSGWGIGVSWLRGPFRFSFYRRGGWWGVGGYRPYHRPPPRVGFHKNNPNRNHNRGDGTRPQSRPNVYNRPETRDRATTRPADRPARPANGAQNNVLTDNSGNVYQRQSDGAWQQRQNGQWGQASNLDRPATTSPSMNNQQFNQWGQGQQAARPQLERDYNARQQGAQRAQSYQRQGRARRR